MNTSKGDLRIRASVDVTREALASAQIAGDLYRAELCALKLALGAANSKVIAARVGHRAAGAGVLAGFFTDLSNEAIGLSGEVNVIATRVARGAVDRWRTRRFLDAVVRAHGALEGDASAEQLVPVGAEAGDRLSSAERAARGDRNQLRVRVQRLDRAMAMADILAINLRVESVDAGADEVQLVNVADRLKSIAADVRGHAATSLKRIGSMD